MSVGNVLGDASNFGNDNSGVIATTVNIGTLIQSNKSTLESLSQRYLDTNWPLSPKAAYNADLGGTLTREPCTPGTRIDILKRIYAWAEDPSPNSPTIFWLTGEAGSGKSTIAFSVARHFGGQEDEWEDDDEADILQDASKILGANFFCSRQFEETRKRMTIIPTIVEQLARKSQPYANALLKANKFDSVNTSQQMKDLLVDPWMRSVSGRYAESVPLLVVVDALDEVEDRGGSAFLEELLRMTYKSHLQGIKFLITSRPDADIMRLCSSFTSDAICALYEVPTDTVKADIATYLQAKLPKLRGMPEVHDLMRQADGLFIFAATVVRYVTPRPVMAKREQIKLLGKLGIHAHGSFGLRNTFASPIDELYKQVMLTAFGGLDDDLLQDRLYALHTLLCTQERVSTSVAGELQSDDPDMAELVEVVVDELRAVLYVKDDRVLWYHSSFPDFIFSEARSGMVSLGVDSYPVDMHCEEAAHHAFLARSCFRIMKSRLRFNICDLPSSFLLDSEVPDLNLRIQANISESLRYSCLYWTQHLARTLSDDGRAKIHDFLQLKVLFWIETMNLLDSRAQCTPMLQQACEYILKGDGGHVSDLARDVVEAGNFATYFCGGQASQSTPHLYISSLATWSRESSKLSRMWKKKFGHIPAFEHTGGEGSLPLLTIWGEACISSVAFSIDGTRIVSGSWDNSVQIWDASTGIELRRLVGHSGSARCVAFSRDGTRIASGSHDMSVRVWDASTGAELRRLNGHYGAVWSVAFSTDGTRIVSGSWDHSVRIWDASTGAELKRLNNHSESVNSVAFSTDGTLIVSCSSDKSVRVWDALTGAELRTLNGHSDGVMSVAFSSDGTRIVSGSSDESVRVWDTSTGAELMKLDGHFRFVDSVAFSSDGTRIVSGSHDNSVRVWDTSTGAELRKLDGHSGYVSSVSFSTDRTRILSGSDDKSVRVWDASGSEMCGSNGHSDGVYSVALSSDGARIVSGSNDGSVRVWDASTGAELRRLNGDRDVRSVALSSDDTRIVSTSYGFPVSVPVRIWDASTGAELRRLNCDCISVAFSKDDTRIVSGLWDNSVRIWDASTGIELKRLNGHSGSVKSVAFSGDGTHIVSGSDDSSVRVWDASTGVELRILNGHSDRVSSVAFSSDGNHIVSSSFDKSVRVWDALTGAELKRLNGHSDIVLSVSFSSDGTLIVSGSCDKSVRVWDVLTGAELRRLDHSDPVLSVAFSSDGTRIVSGLSDGSVVLWELVTRNPWEISSHGSWIMSLPHHQRLMWAPQEVINILNPPGVLLNISSKPSTKVNFTDSRIGPAWVDCYTPKTF